MGKNGTSLSAPMVAGAAALLRSYIPDLGHAQIEEVIKETAETTADTARDGAGRLNVYHALQALFVPDVQLTLEEPLRKISAPGDKFVRITWGEYTTLTITKYRIWKKVDSGSWSLWQDNIPLSQRNKVDTQVSPGHTYHYIVEGKDGNDASYPIRGKSPSESIEYPEGGPERSSPTTGNELPEELELRPNFHNPFNPFTQIRFGLPTSTRVRLQIMNIRGQVVRVLIDEERPAGWYEVTWDGKNESGINVASGIYLYMIEADSKKILKKMTIIR